jgi:hypothetical protein
MILPYRQRDNKRSFKVHGEACTSPSWMIFKNCKDPDWMKKKPKEKQKEKKDEEDNEMENEADTVPDIK